MLMVAFVGVLGLLGKNPTETLAATSKVKLGSGHVQGWNWSTSLSGDSGLIGGQRVPCITAELTPRRPAENPLAITQKAVSCGSLLYVPSLVSVSDETSIPNVTVLAMAFSERTTSVRLFLHGREPKRIPLKLVPAQKARQANVERFRFAALAFVGQFCLERFVAFSQDGDQVEDGGRMKCPRNTVRS
jgi:hypothetical protein